MSRKYDSSGRDCPGPGNCLGPDDGPPDGEVTREDLEWRAILVRMQERRKRDETRNLLP